VLTCTACGNARPELRPAAKFCLECGVGAVEAHGGAAAKVDGGVQSRWEVAPWVVMK
jgi:hypothetical protein